jgi:hypothetical protein
MRDDAAPGPLTPASTPKASGRLGREDARNFPGTTTYGDGFGVGEGCGDGVLCAEEGAEAFGSMA